MRGYCIVFLLVVTVLLPDTDGWLVRRRWIRRTARNVGRFYRRNKGWINPAVIATVSGRDVGAASLDANKDGTIDQSEAAAVVGEQRAARDLLSHADIDGDSLVTVEEFERSVRDLIMADSDELQKHMADDGNFSE